MHHRQAESRSRDCSQPHGLSSVVWLSQKEADYRRKSLEPDGEAVLDGAVADPRYQLTR